MRLPALALLLLALAGAHAAPVSLSDDFDGKSAVTWATLRGDWHAAGGMCHASGTGFVERYLQGMTFRDLTLAADCRINDYAIPADWVGLAVGADDKTGLGNGYLVYLRYSGEVELFSGAQIIMARMTGARAKFAAGQFVRLQVAVRGAHLSAAVDGQAVIDYDAPGAVTGQVGLMTCDVKADYAHLRLEGDRLQNMIQGQVLSVPQCIPVAGARVEIYNSMDGYNSPVTRQTVSDAGGRYSFGDLPAGDRAYWLRAGSPGHGGTTAWFVSVTDKAPTSADLCLVGAPRHEVWVAAADARDTNLRKLEDPQCFGGSRLEVKEARPGDTQPRWWAALPFTIESEGDYVPHLAAGQYPTPYYWSDFWWSVDGQEPLRASRTLTLEGDRYGDRATMSWGYAAPVHLKAGRHTLRVLLRDPVPAAPARPDGQKVYSWAFDGAAFAQIPGLLAPVQGRRVATARPTLRWQAAKGAARYTVQLSQEPDFRNATQTVGGVREASFTPLRDLPDGTYFWRVKAYAEEELPYPVDFTPAQSFVVATGGPVVTGVRVVSRTPTEAVVAWETDQPCTSRLRFGLSSLAYSGVAEGATAPTRSHRARLSPLEPMTYYYYAPEVTSGAGRVALGLRRGLCTPRGALGDRNSPFGIFGQGLVYSRELGAAGARWYSDYWEWGALEPARGQFNWAEAQERMDRAKAAGVNLMVTFFTTPAWVRPSHPEDPAYGPDDLQDARDFFRAVAGHCRGRMNWWLPWIEPNVARDMTFGYPMGYWAGRPHARSLSAYQRAAYQGAKAGDPDCRVVGMNTAGVDLDFIRKCYDEGAAEDFDVMNVHYYAITEPFERQNPEAVFRGLRALMSEYGDSEKPILCSEGGGASSGLPGTDESTQADNIIRIFTLTVANDIDRLCWTFELDEKPYGSKRVDMIMWMGLFRFDPRTSAQSPAGEPKPSYYAFRTMTGILAGTEYGGPVNLGPGVRAYYFQAPGRRVTVAWAENGKVTVKLPVAGREVTLTDRRGQSRRRAVSAGGVVLRLTGSPVFISEER